MSKQTSASLIFDLLETALSRMRERLPHEGLIDEEFHSSNDRLSPATRTELAFIEDTRDAALEILYDDAAPELLKALQAVQRLELCDADQINETHSDNCLGCMIEAALYEAQIKNDSK